MHPLPRTCKENGINARIADKAVWERLKTILSSPSLLKTQAGKYLMGSKTNGISTLGIDIESTKNEILRLEGKENKYADAYSEGVISIEKLKEFVVPLGERIILLKKNLAQAYAEQKPKLETMQPTNEEIELFTKEVSGFLNNLSFASKKVIIQKAVTKVYSTQKDLQVHGSINLNELHVFLFSDDRYCWFAERGEVHAF